MIGFRSREAHGRGSGLPRERAENQFIVKTINQDLRRESIMENFADERDLLLLEKDKYTFNVLRRVIGGKCKLLLTDHERLMICFTGEPFPVWIWTPDDASAMEMERVYRIAAEHSLLNGKYRLNLKYELADYLIKRAGADGKKFAISSNMFAYDCLFPRKPIDIADGLIHRCVMEDIDELAEFMDLSQKEMGSDQRSHDDNRANAESAINTGNVFFWKNEQGRNVASCKFVPCGNLATVNLVFTRPEFRRKHYAANLVYQVTKIALDAGYVPMLYTDADYIPSNECYKKIGYERRGKICTIA